LTTYRQRGTWRNPARVQRKMVQGLGHYTRGAESKVHGHCQCC